MGKSKEYDGIPVPCHCPVCNMGVFTNTIARGFKDWKDEQMSPRWHCHYCNTFFTWDAETRIVRNIETRFSRGLLGNVDVDGINKGYGNKYVDGKLPDEYDPPSYNHSKHFQE